MASPLRRRPTQPLIPAAEAGYLGRSQVCLCCVCYIRSYSEIFRQQYQLYLRLASRQASDMMRVISSSSRAFTTTQRSAAPITCIGGRSMHASLVLSQSQLQHQQPRRVSSPVLRSSQRHQARNMTAAAASAEPLYDIYIKGAPEEGLVCERGELGDCKWPRYMHVTNGADNLSCGFSSLSLIVQAHSASEP